MPGVRPFRVRAKPLAALVALLVVVVAAERLHWFGWLRAARGPSLVWIWSADPPNSVSPRAFLVARDFDLGTLPAQAFLEIQADPEYVVYLNGERIGSGAYRPDALLDRFDVAAKLESGANRVVLELRSAIGSGGATLRIEDGAGRALVATDERWHFYPKSWKGLFENAELWGGTYAKVLGRSPLGRWGRPGCCTAEPLFSDATALGGAIGARAYRLPLSSRHWIEIGRRARARPGLGGLVEFDFGEPVSGYLHLDLAPEVTDPALARFANFPADRVGWMPDVVVLPVGNRGYWQDAVPRRFRYVEIAGMPSVRGAAVLPVRPEDWLALSSQAPLHGLLGLEPPAVRVPVIDQIWKNFLDLPLAPVPDATDVIRRGGRARKRERPREPAAPPRPEGR